TIEPLAGNIHGRFTAKIAPILTIDSGDTVTFKLIDAGWNTYALPADFDNVEKFTPRNREVDRGHAMHGPIAIEGAKTGMVLEIRLREIVVGEWGWSGAGWRDSFNETYDLETPPEMIYWTFSEDKQTATNQDGMTVKLTPFLGNIGMPPEVSGEHSTTPPRWCGGNIDCKELVAGSTLYLPISVDGALISFGDGHAVQGNGEVAGPALECGMERVVIDMILRDDLDWTMPRAHTPAGWVTFGFNEDLKKAQEQALYEMLTLITEQYKVTRRYAHSLASLLVDLNVTQIVNGVQGVHAILPHGAIE
ncbi:MAG: acetamidase/formamidase family protein, partial [Chloroflexota bacterium]